MTDDFERRIRRDLDAIAEQVPVGSGGETPVVGVGGTTARRGTHGLAFATAAGFVLILGILAWLPAGSGDDDGTDVAGTPTTGDTSSQHQPTDSRPATTSTAIIGEAPPSQTGSHRIWMSTDVVSAAGTDVTFAVVGPPIDGEVWGAATLLEQWTGDTWQVPGNAFGYCGLDWTCSLGEQSPADVVLVWEDGVLGHETVHIAGLDDGWYRLRKTIEGEPATAVFRSVSEDLGAAVAPTLPWQGAEGEIDTSPVVLDSQGSVLGVRFNYRDTNILLPRLDVERWENGSWRPLLSIDVGSGLPSEILLPAMPPGEYRIVAGEDWSESRFWVADDISDRARCHTDLDLAALLGGEAAAFVGPQPPTAELRGSFRNGGFRAEWIGPDQTIRYSYPMGSVIDLVGERYFQDGPLLLRPLGDAVEVWVELPGCAGIGTVTAGFVVSGGSEQQDVSLAARLGRSFAQLWNADGGTPAWEQCPNGESVTSTPRNGVILDVWMYCREVGDDDSRLVPVATNIISESPIESAIRRGLGGGWNGLESAIPLELQWSLSEITIADGVLTIDWGWDFAADPIDNITTSYWSGRIVAQIAANAFQFDEIDAIDLGDLPFEVDRPFVYTREQWEQSEADN